MNLSTKSLVEVLICFSVLCSSEWIWQLQLVQINRWTSSLSSEKEGMIFLSSLFAQFTSLSFPFFNTFGEPHWGQQQGFLNWCKNSLTGGMFFGESQIREGVSDKMSLYFLRIVWSEMSYFSAMASTLERVRASLRAFTWISSGICLYTAFSSKTVLITLVSSINDNEKLIVMQGKDNSKDVIRFQVLRIAKEIMVSQ